MTGAPLVAFSSLLLPAKHSVERVIDSRSILSACLYSDRGFTSGRCQRVTNVIIRLRGAGALGPLSNFRSKQ